MAINYQSFYDSLFGGHGILEFHSVPDEDELAREMRFHEMYIAAKRRKHRKKKNIQQTITTLYAVDSFEEDVMAFDAVTSFTCQSGPPPTVARVVDYLNDLKEEQVHIEVITCHQDSYEIITPFVKNEGDSSQIIAEYDHGYYFCGQRKIDIGEYPISDGMRLHEDRINHKHCVRFKLIGPASYTHAVNLHRIFKRAVLPTLHTGGFGTKVKIRRIGYIDSA